MNLTPFELIVGGWLFFGAGLATASYIYSAGVEVTPGEIGFPRSAQERFLDTLGLTARAIAWPYTAVWLWFHSNGMSWALMKVIAEKQLIEKHLSAYRLELVRTRFGRHSGTDGHDQECKHPHPDGDCRRAKSGGDAQGPGAGAA